MGLNLETAFSFIKKDCEWKNKLLVGGLLMMIPVLLNSLTTLTIKPNQNIDLSIIILILILFVASIFLSVAVTGYYIKTAHSNIEKDNKELPAWNDLNGLMGLGFKYYVGYFLYSVPFTLIGIFFIAMFFAHASLNLPLAIFFAFLTVILFSIMALFSFLMIANFAKDLKVLSFVNYPLAADLLRNNWKNYLLLVVFNILISSIFGFITFILGITVIGIVFIPFVTFYMMLVSADLIAQFVKTKNQ